MKILLLNQTFYPDSTATSQQVTDLALYLTALGHRVTVVTDRADYEKRQTVYPSYESYRGIDIHRVSSTVFGKKSVGHRIIDGVTFNLTAFFRLIQLPRQDVVISFTSPPLIGFLGTVYAAMSRARSVQWLMDVNPDAAIAVGYLDPRKPTTRLLVELFELTLRRASHIVVLDRWMRERMIDHGAVPERIAIVPPWPAHDTPEAQHRPSREENAFRQEHGLGEKFVVMYSGNHSIVHPLDTLLEAALRLRDDDSVRFVFVGGGLRVRDVTAWVEKHGLKNVVQLPHQPREMLGHSLAAADLHAVVMGEKVTGLVHTSKLYGILATGTPYVFVGPAKSHVVDLQKECPHGFHVEHGDAEGLVRCIRAAQRLTPAERGIIDRANRGYVTSHYAARLSLESFATQVLKPLSDEDGSATSAVQAA